MRLSSHPVHFTQENALPGWIVFPPQNSPAFHWKPLSGSPSAQWSVPFSRSHRCRLPERHCTGTEFDLRSLRNAAPIVTCQAPVCPQIWARHSESIHFPPSMGPVTPRQEVIRPEQSGPGQSPRIFLPKHGQKPKEPSSRGSFGFLPFHLLFSSAFPESVPTPHHRSVPAGKASGGLPR